MRASRSVLTYCTNALDAQRENAAFQMVRPPDELAFATDYGLTVMTQAPVIACRFAMFILSAEGSSYWRNMDSAPDCRDNTNRHPPLSLVASILGDLASVSVPRTESQATKFGYRKISTRN
jgi:hypothetical protein